MSFATWLGNHVMPSKLISEDEEMVRQSLSGKEIRMLI